jgi:uncharacterized membrane protein YqjE
MAQDVSELTSQSTADLIRRASEQVSTLVRHELELARAELTEKGKRAGVGAGMFGAAGALAFYGLGAVLFCIGLALALVMPEWLAALIVAVVLFAVAGVLALLGRAQLKRAIPPIPTEAVQSTREDVEAVSSALARRSSQ